jgi:signal peptidase II
MTFAWFCVWVGVMIVGGDAVSKYFVQALLPVMSIQFPLYPYGGIAIFKDFLGIEFSITHLTNSGAAWGALKGYQDYLLLVRLLLLAAMLVYVYRLNKQPALQFFLTLVIAGAFGNVLDYFIYGHVIDMLHFVLWGYDFPVFNIADSAVCVGVFGLIAVSSRQETNRQSTHA